ncbi:putative ribonuclease p protein subunit [Botrytis fragariae]|uniref:Putative ribonuclease p protein subunit n=1 Tax=Botrytis fragariae TaxID=1964551 RepID=A0A8H6ASR6_9HELO|nr:putative ribonuclease p protein subunit [Botrytis fragariae]KAF5872947.1 putative ribonuclease p protein subunit [Botrytis fragariae]
MAKSQATKGVSKVPNKVLYSRMSYLYQAATYLVVQDKESQEQSAKGTALDSSMEDVMKDESKAVANVTEGPHQALSRRLITDLRSVSLKGLMRMSPDMKHSICKNCQTLLLEGTTCTAKVENQSKGGKKPWADVLVRKCHTCGLEKRFPLATERQPRRPKRSIQEAKSSAV